MSVNRKVTLRVGRSLRHSSQHLTPLGSAAHNDLQSAVTPALYCRLPDGHRASRRAIETAVRSRHGWCGWMAPVGVGVTECQPAWSSVIRAIEDVHLQLRSEAGQMLFSTSPKSAHSQTLPRAARVAGRRFTQAAPRVAVIQSNIRRRRPRVHPGSLARATWPGIEAQHPCPGLATTFDGLPPRPLSGAYGKLLDWPAGRSTQRCSFCHDFAIATASEVTATSEPSRSTQRPTPVDA
ncbi:MAG: hypothetical protein ACI8TP_005291 [Acidimicrobiales bacterium]|jgi:hypothetical protein